MSIGKRRGGRPLRPVAGMLVALTVGLTGLTGCTNATPPADASSGNAESHDAAPHDALTGDGPEQRLSGPQRWCPDESWLTSAAGLYVAAYKKARHPVSAKTIDHDLSADGPLRKRYRRLAGKGTVPADLSVHELGAFLAAVADADASGTDPVKYAHHIVAVCDS